MSPKNLEELKTWCLRELGAPVLNVNIDDSQLENQIEKALEYFAEFADAGKEQTYLKHRVTATVLNVSNANAFKINENITTSGGVVVRVTRIVSSTVLEVITQGIILPLVGQTLVGQISGATDTISSLTYGDIDLGYIPVADAVSDVIKVYPLTSSIYGAGIFDIRYQLRLNDLFDLYSTEMVYYTNVMQHLSLIENLLVTDKQFRFNKLTNKLYIDMDWKTTVVPGEYIIVSACTVLDPVANPKIYNDRIFKKLCVAYTKRMWGINMKRYQGVVILGGLTMNGQQMYEEAEDEIDKTEALIRDTYATPAGFFCG